MKIYSLPTIIKKYQESYFGNKTEEAVESYVGNKTDEAV